MKRNNLISIFKIGLLLILVAVIGQSCVKSVSGRTDFENLTPTVLMSDGGIANFQSNALLFPPTDPADTTYFHVEYASTSTAPQDEVVTFAIDQAALDAYNAQGGNQYAIFPDSIYSFTATSVTIPKGNNYSAGIPLIVFPDKINLLDNYMLPISIKTAPAGSTIASNYTTIYYHLIGNPIAGLYSQEWIRYNKADMSGTPDFDQDLSPGVFAPLDGTTISVASGTGTVYILSFTNTGGVLSNFQVSFDPASTAGITITGGPTIVTADPATKTYVFNFTYNNASGLARNITDKFGPF